MPIRRRTICILTVLLAACLLISINSPVTVQAAANWQTSIPTTEPDLRTPQENYELVVGALVLFMVILFGIARFGRKEGHGG